MNRHYDKYLVTKYEPLYRNRYGDMQTTAMCWGFECGDGWFNIINNLSYMLCADWLQVKKDYDRIKDRLGKKRFDSELDDPYNIIVTEEEIHNAKERMNLWYDRTPVATQVKEKYGTLRFYIDGGTDEHYGAIQFAEHMSAVTCEVCGNKGKPNRDGGWISTRCEKHRDD